MLHASVRRTLIGLAVSVAAALGAAGSLQAAVYKGAWDPAYGFGGNSPTTFPNLGWAGSATITIPDTCAITAVLTSATCDGMTAGYALVDLYTPGDNGLAGATATELLSFNWIVAVSKATFTGTELTGADSAMFPAVPSVSGLADTAGYSFSLQLSSELGALLYYSKSNTGGDDSSDSDNDNNNHRHGDGGDDRHHRHDNDADRHRFGKGNDGDHDRFGYRNDGDHHRNRGSEGDGQEDDVCRFPGTSAGNTVNCGINDWGNHPALVTYELVPEPPTYALMLTALGAVGFVVRRRRQ